MTADELLGDYGRLAIKQYALCRDNGMTKDMMVGKSNFWYQLNREPLQYRVQETVESGNGKRKKKVKPELIRPLQRETLEKAGVTFDDRPYGFHEARQMLRNLALLQGTDLEYIAHINEENAKAKIKAEKRKTSEAAKKAEKKGAALESLPLAFELIDDDDDDDDTNFFKSLKKTVVK